MAEKLTPIRFGQVKTIQGTNGPFNSVGFQTKEYGDRWFNFAFNLNGENPLKEGQTYDLDIKERPYKDKNGDSKIAYDTKKPNAMADMAKTLMSLSVRLWKLEERVTALEPKTKVTIQATKTDDIESINAELAYGQPDEDPR